MPLGNPIRKQNESRMVSVLATEGQTVFTVQGGYIINHISVFRNGVRLSPAEDFTAGDGSTVTLNNAANIDDRIDFHIFDRFTVQNAIIGAASTQTINGDLVLNGKLFGQLDVPSINLTGIVTATELDLNGKGDISGDLNVVGVTTTGGGNINGDLNVTGVTTVGKQVHVGTGVSIAAGGLNVTAGISTFQAVQGTTGTFSAAVSGTTGTFTGDVDIADKIVHTGDTNTAIRFPSADTFTVETGGTERVRIDSSGRILKGITSARGNYGNNTSGVEYAIQLEGTSAIAAGLSIIRNSNDGNDGGIVLGKTRATSNGGNTVVQAGDDLGNLTFAGSDGTSLLFGAEIFAEVQSGVGNDDLPTDLIFKTNSGTTSTTERVRIKDDGKVGIGVNDPDAKLEVLEDVYVKGSSGDGSVGIQIRSGASALSNQHQIRTGGGSGDQLFIEALGASSAIVTKVAGSERLRITSAGLVGIGTASPGGLFHTHTASGTNRNLIEASASHAFLRLKAGSTSYNSGLEFYSGASNIANISALGGGGVTFEVGGSERVRITSSGHLKLPDAAELRLGGAQDASGDIVIQHNGSNSSITNNTGGFYISGDGTDLHLRSAVHTTFSTGGSNERVRLDSTGRIQMGSDTSNLGQALVNIVTGGENGISIGKNATGTVSSGDVLGTYAFQNSIGSQTTNSAEASIKGIAAENSSGSTAATDLAFFTKPSGTGPGSSPTERFRFGSLGQLGIAGANYGSSGQVLTSGGSGGAVSWAAASGGKVLQVISSVKANATASNSTGASSTWEYDDSSLRVQITAANANNIFLILASVTTASSASVHVGLRDSSSNTVLIATNQGSRRAATSGHDQSDSHSASTVPIIGTITAGDTNQHSFYFQFSHTSGSTQTIYLNRGTNDGNGTDRGRYISSIVVMEIEA